MQRVAYSFVMALMGVVVVAAAALIIAGRIARPIENLNRVAQEVKGATFRFGRPRSVQMKLVIFARSSIQ